MFIINGKSSVVVVKNKRLGAAVGAGSNSTASLDDRGRVEVAIGDDGSGRS